MPITVEWFPEPYIRRSIITGTITTPDMESWAQGELTILNSHSHVIHFITEVGGMSNPKANNILTMTTVKTFIQHPNTGWITVVGATPLVSFVSLMLQRVTGMRFMPFNTTEEAQAYLLELVQIAQENQHPVVNPTLYK